jgi:hypothetical protein
MDSGERTCIADFGLVTRGSLSGTKTASFLVVPDGVHLYFRMNGDVIYCCFVPREAFAAEWGRMDEQARRLRDNN